MKTHRLRELKIVLTLASIVCLGLMLLGLSTSAWFYQNTKVKSIQNIQLDDIEPGISSCMVYECKREYDGLDSEAGITKDYAYDSAPSQFIYPVGQESVDDNEAVITFSLKPYDSIFTKKNDTTALVYKFELEGITSVPSQVKINFAVENTGSNPISKVAEIKIAAEKSIDGMAILSLSEDIYKKAKGFFASNGSAVDISSSSEITVTLNNENNVLDPDENGKVRLFMIIDYDVEKLSDVVDPDSSILGKVGIVNHEAVNFDPSNITVGFKTINADD